MTQQVINTGTIANDGTGDGLRTSFTKINNNFTELYTESNSQANTLIVTFDAANAAFAAANSVSSDADEKANAAIITANAAFDKANTVSGDADEKANAALITANLSFDKANSANVLAYNTGIGANAYASAVGVASNTVGSAAFIAANAAFAAANSVSSDADEKANAALSTANIVFDVANAAFAAANSVSSDADEKANAALITANLAFDKANSANVLAYDTGIGANAYASAVGVAANLYSATVGTSANAFTSATIAGANTAVGTAANAYADIVGTSANAFTTAATVAANNFAGTMANAANAYAVSTFLANTTGTFNGDLTIKNDIFANNITANTVNLYDSTGNVATRMISDYPEAFSLYTTLNNDSTAGIGFANNSGTAMAYLTGDEVQITAKGGTNRIFLVGNTGYDLTSSAQLTWKSHYSGSGTYFFIIETPLDAIGMGAGYTLRLPKNVGSNNQVFTSDGTGNTAWTDPVKSNAPASASATGRPGEIRFDSDYIYVCVATDTWKRAAIATWP